MIGVDHADLVKKITQVVPDYMAMGDRGMADMADMQMPIPDNTVPMMGGEGPFGSVEMGGMFSMVKVRRSQKPGDYSDPGWYAHPKGTQAYEWTGALAEPARAAAPRAVTSPSKDVEVQVRKPSGHAGH
jgi:hypothetical protein